MKTYEKIENTDNQFLKIELNYNKGGMNYWTGRMEARGYYLYVQRVERTDYGGHSIESFIVGQGGVRSFLLEVKRQSPKAKAQAEELAKAKVDELKNAILTGLYN